MDNCCLAAYHMHSNRDPEGFELFLKDPHQTVFLLEMKFKTEKDDLYSQLQVVLDYISNMTDLYAVQLYKDLRGIE